MTKQIIIGTVIVVVFVLAIVAAPSPPKVLTGHVTYPDGSATLYLMNRFALESSYTPVDSLNTSPAWVPADVPNACQGSPESGFESTPCHFLFPTEKLLWKVYRPCVSGETITSPPSCYCKKVAGKKCQ